MSLSIKDIIENPLIINEEYKFIIKSNKPTVEFIGKVGEYTIKKIEVFKDKPFQGRETVYYLYAHVFNNNQNMIIHILISEDFQKIYNYKITNAFGNSLTCFATIITIHNGESLCKKFLYETKHFELFVEQETITKNTMLHMKNAAASEY